MLKLSYDYNLDEITKVTLMFIENRPILKILINAMNLLSVTMFVVYIFLHYHNLVNVNHIMSAITAISWLLFRKKVNRFILRNNLKKANLQNSKVNIEIHDKKIQYNCKNSCDFKELLWKKVKFIYQNKLGYMIPLTGYANSGKFIWLPKNSFNSESQEISFIEFIRGLNLKIKKLR